MNIQRYDPYEKTWCGAKITGQMQRDDDGDWARYEDSAAQTEEIKRLREELSCALYWLLRFPEGEWGGAATGSELRNLRERIDKIETLLSATSPNLKDPVI